MTVRLGMPAGMMKTNGSMTEAAETDDITDSYERILCVCGNISQAFKNEASSDRQCRSHIEQRTVFSTAPSLHGQDGRPNH